jgi:hypothetical protein
MSKFIKRLMCVLFATVTLSGAVLALFGVGDFYKIHFSTPVDLNDVDSSKFTDGTLVSGEVYYVIDSIASSYSTELFDQSKVNYYLVPINCGEYVVVATGNSSEVTMFNKIFQQTCQYLNQEIEDTYTSVSVDGKLLPMDDDLREMLYTWADSTDYFTADERAQLDELVLPNVLHTQDWDNVTVLTVTGFVVVVVGVVGLVLSIRALRKG